MTAVCSLSLKQFLAIGHLLLFQELLGFVPCKGLGTLQLPKWGLTKRQDGGRWQAAGKEAVGGVRSRWENSIALLFGLTAREVQQRACPGTVSTKGLSLQRYFFAHMN